MRILVAGIGNMMRSDDGVGVVALERLRDLESEDVRVVAIGTAVLRSEGHLSWADRVLAIDAVRMGREPGTVWTGSLDEVDADGFGTSSHGLELKSMVRLLPKTCRPEVFVIGVEPASTEFGLGLSASVRRALHEVSRLARRTVEAWRSSGQGG